MLLLLLSLLFAGLEMIRSGHEILLSVVPSHDNIKSEEVTILQFDSRPIYSYWNVTSRWNKAFADKFNHKYLYLSSLSPCTIKGLQLAEAWCKVKAMTKAHKLAPSSKAFLFLDSDALITVNYSMSTVINFMRQSLNWDINDKPVALNQDGPGWSCKATMKNGYSVCLNSGSLIWMNTPIALEFIQSWWESAADPYGINKFPSKWRLKWPWEQAQLYEMYYRYKDHVQILSFPELKFLPWKSTKNPKSQYPTDAIEPWCFSHWPIANCFITHFCASKKQKLKMAKNYDLHTNFSLEVRVHYIDLI